MIRASLPPLVNKQPIVLMLLSLIAVKVHVLISFISSMRRQPVYLLTARALWCWIQ